LDGNTPPERHQGGGAVREGSALLQGLAICGNCGRRLRTRYAGRASSPVYYCFGQHLTDGRGLYCLRVGGVAIDQTVAQAFLRAVTPAAVEVTIEAMRQLQANQDAALSQWRLEVERMRYEAERAERRYRTVDPENRLVARGLEAEWEKRLRELSSAEAELLGREQRQPRALTSEQLARVRVLGSDLQLVWNAPSTTDRDRKELLRTLLEEVVLTVNKSEHRAHLILRWRGGSITPLDVALPRGVPTGLCTEGDTIDLIRRLAPHYADDTIAGILNRQGRKSATGERFTALHVRGLRRYRKMPRFEPQDAPPTGDLVTVRQAAKIFGLAPSTLHRYLNDGYITGEQITPGAPWRIRMNEQLRGRFVEEAPPDYLTMQEAIRKLGVSRQTVLQRVKRGELEAIHVSRGRRKGLRIRVMETEPGLFEQTL
jgi:predicted DNA-binding transcriptional regulator AlpA